MYDFFAEKFEKPAWFSSIQRFLAQSNHFLYNFSILSAFLQNIALKRRRYLDPGVRGADPCNKVLVFDRRFLIACAICAMLKLKETF